MPFRDNLNRVCREKGTTLSRVCKELGISTAQVTAINKGAIPSEEMLLAFSHHLRCLVTDFFSDEETTFDIIPADDDEEDLIEGYRALSRQQKHKLMAYLYELQETSEEVL